ncbi:MAG: VWA domain-containing protein [Verrucomicrobiota bacterium]
MNLAVVLDRSGSMGGAKLEQAKQAALMLVEQLDEDDVFSLVVYDTEVDVLVPAGRIGNKRKNLRRMIERIQTGGSTALYAGVKTGGQQLMEFISRKRINRVLLLSDGLANVGPKSNREITSLGQRLARQDVSVTTIGLGDSYNEDLMTALAEASDANYYYVDDVEMLADVFRQELGELQKIVARDLIIEIKFPKGVIPIEVMGREQAVSGQRAVIKFAQISAQQKRQLLVRCRVDPDQYEKQQAVADVIMNYQDTQLGDGLAREIHADVRVGWTEEKSLALAAIDREVEVEAALCQNAIESKKTIAWSDKGDIAKACAQIGDQITRLSSVAVAAPASKQKEIKEELAILEANQKDLQSGQLNKAGRKQMQLNVYKKSNSK